MVPGAGNGIRTREYQLGKLGPYHLATPACAHDASTPRRFAQASAARGFCGTGKRLARGAPWDSRAPLANNERDGTGRATREPA